VSANSEFCSYAEPADLESHVKHGDKFSLTLYRLVILDKKFGRS